MEAGPVLVQFQGEVYAGILLGWRKDRDQNTMKGLVRFMRAGREVQLWFPQGQIRASVPDDSSTVEEQWSTDAVDRLLAAIQAEDASPDAGLPHEPKAQGPDSAPGPGPT